MVLKVITLRITCDEYAVVKEVAHERRVSMNEFVRQAVLKAVQTPAKESDVIADQIQQIESERVDSQ